MKKAGSVPRAAKWLVTDGVVSSPMGAEAVEFQEDGDVDRRRGAGVVLAGHAPGEDPVLPSRRGTGASPPLWKQSIRLDRV